MMSEELKTSITEFSAGVTYDETGEMLNAIVPAADFRSMMKNLRHKAEWHFDYLFCLTCIDWKTHLMMVYHLRSRQHRHELVVKVKLDDIKNPAIDTVCDIWQTANFHEREVFDLFGVNFRNHPDMRRIMLDDNWDGFPLRKNYVDENMISL